LKTCFVKTRRAITVWPYGAAKTDASASNKKHKKGGSHGHQHPPLSDSDDFSSGEEAPVKSRNNSHHGKVVQVDPMKHTLKAPVLERLKLRCDKRSILLSIPIWAATPRRRARGAPQADVPQEVRRHGRFTWIARRVQRQRWGDMCWVLAGTTPVAMRPPRASC